MNQNTSPSQNRGFLDRFFRLSESGTTVRTELVAGLTTFVTMAYIIVVNPSILEAAGMEKGALFTATLMAAAISTAFMGLYANWPFALAPGMGMNAFFAFFMVGVLKLPWQTALGAVFISGILALLVSITGIREFLIRAIPASLKSAVGAGIGLFILLIGLKSAGVVVASEPTLVALGNLKATGVITALLGLLISAALVARRVPGGLLIGIVITTIIGIPLGVTTVPTQVFSAPPSLAPGLFKLDILGALKPALFATIFSLFFADLFDTIGTFVGVAGKAGLMDKEGNLKGGGRALLADSVGTIFGALLGTSNTTTYVESAAGIAAGGRTGLTSVTTALLFLASAFVAPLALAVPAQATAPALIIVGILMCSAFLEIDLHDFTEAVPAVITIVMMPFSFSIANGLAMGFLAYVVLNVAIGRAAKVHWVLYALAAFFLYHFFLA